MLCLHTELTCFNLLSFYLLRLHLFLYNDLNRNFNNLLNYSIYLLYNNFFNWHLFNDLFCDDSIFKNNLLNFLDLDHWLFDYPLDLNSFDYLIWLLNLFDFNYFYRDLLNDLSNFNFNLLWNFSVDVFDDLNRHFYYLLYDLYLGGLNRNLYKSIDDLRIGSLRDISNIFTGASNIFSGAILIYVL